MLFLTPAASLFNIGDNLGFSMLLKDTADDPLCLLSSQSFAALTRRRSTSLRFRLFTFSWLNVNRARAVAQWDVATLY